jgi:hypothetical protein
MVSSAICLISLEPAGETSSRVREQFALRAVRLRAPIFISEFTKYRLRAHPNQLYLFGRPVPLEGRFAIVTSAGRDAVDADGASDEGAGRGRRSRVVLTPRRWCQVRGGNSTGDGGKRARSPGRARYKP